MNAWNSRLFEAPLVALVAKTTMFYLIVLCVKECCDLRQINKSQ